MSVLITATLDSTQKAMLLSMDAGFPMDDADFFALCQDGDHLYSAAAFIQEDNSCYECYAFTSPEFRRQGFFTDILDVVIDELPEDVEFMFYTNGKNGDCMATLNALEAELVQEEHMMEIDLKQFADSSVLEGASLLPLTKTENLLDGTAIWEYHNLNGTVNISVYSSFYYLYGFEIREELRGMGHGTIFLQQLLHDLAANNPMPLRLQVSGDNLPALSLYKKTGFRIIETLSGYVY